MRFFLLVTAKHLIGGSVSSLMLVFVPWSEQMNAHGLKTTHVGYGCSSVIHNFSTNQRIEGPIQSDQTSTSHPSHPPCQKARKDVMMPPICCLLLYRRDV